MIEILADDELPDDDAGTPKEMDRLLCTTKVMSIHKEYDVVLQHLCSAFQLMANSHTNYSSVLPRCLLKFHKGTTTVNFHPLSYKEVHEKVGFSKFPQRSTKTLVALEDLGRGENGKAWLCGTVTQPCSAVCVLKFDNKGTSKHLESERDMWHLLYPEFQHMVNVEMWSGAYALVMPHLATVLTEEREKYRKKIEVVLTAFMEKKKVHKDVRWRNIGKYRREDGEVEIVIFDLHNVVDYDANSHHSWIEESMKSLYLDRT